MHEPEDLTQEQIQSLRQDLREQVQELVQTIDASRRGSKPVKLDPSSVGRLTRMDAIQGQHMAKANLRNLELRLRQTEQALKLMEQERYGMCRTM